MTEKTYFYDGRTYLKSEIQKLLNPDEKEYKKSDQRTFHTLRMIEGKDILDVGCASGRLCKYMAQKGFKVHGIDVLETAIEIAKEFNSIPNTTYEVRDFLEHPFPENSFDCITFTEVIEHVENPAQYLKEFYRILRPNGHIILSTPNATSLKNFFYALSYRKKAKRENIAKEIAAEPRSTGTQLEHIYNWDYPTLIRLLDRCGFEPIDHVFVRSGPIILPIFGKRVQIIKMNSKILGGFESLMVDQIIKARKRSS